MRYLTSTFYKMSSLVCILNSDPTNHCRLSQPCSQSALSRILRCFCLAVPQLGYCQGLNLLAGALLLVATNCGSSYGKHTLDSKAGFSSNGLVGEQQQMVVGEDGDVDYVCESSVLGCLMSIAADVLPGYFSPAMVAPQVSVYV